MTGCQQCLAWWESQGRRLISELHFGHIERDAAVIVCLAVLDREHEKHAGVAG